MKTVQKLLIAGALAAGITGAFAGNFTFVANAEDAPLTDAENVQKVVTEYSDLWTGTVVFKTGVPVQWYVHVPEDTEPKGCGATIKIPSLGWGTDSSRRAIIWCMSSHRRQPAIMSTPAGWVPDVIPTTSM